MRPLKVIEKDIEMKEAVFAKSDKLRKEATAKIATLEAQLKKAKAARNKQDEKSLQAEIDSVKKVEDMHMKAQESAFETKRELERELKETEAGMERLAAFLAERTNFIQLMQRKLHMYKRIKDQVKIQAAKVAAAGQPAEIAAAAALEAAKIAEELEEEFEKFKTDKKAGYERHRAEGTLLKEYELTAEDKKEGDAGNWTEMCKLLADLNKEVLSAKRAATAAEMDAGEVKVAAATEAERIEFCKATLLEAEDRVKTAANSLTTYVNTSGMTATAPSETLKKLRAIKDATELRKQKALELPKFNGKVEKIANTDKTFKGLSKLVDMISGRVARVVPAADMRNQALRVEAGRYQMAMAQWMRAKGACDERWPEYQEELAELGEFLNAD